MLKIIMAMAMMSFSVAMSFAQNNGSGGSDSGGSVGQDGMPGCNGGTDPAPDGKFYIPGTTQECNPSDDDRKKVKEH